MENKTIYDVAILGAGPAGVTAMIYAQRKKMKAILIADGFGGQAVVAAQITNIPGHTFSISGAQMALGFKKQLEAVGAELVLNKIREVKKEKDIFKVITENQEEILARTVLTTLGRKHRDLSVPGEDKFKGKGIAYCSTCDAPIFKDKIVAVVGAGNTAFSSALDLVPYAEKIYILVRSEAVKADAVLVETVKKEKKVEIIFNAQTEEIFGDVLVTGLQYREGKTNEIKKIAVGGIFINIGMVPNSSPVENLAELNELKEIKVRSANGTTSQEGLWAAGDITDLPHKQILTAAGDSIRAILDIYDWLLRRG